jgi:hypothetical protein
MSTTSEELIWLVEIQGYNPTTPGLETLRFSSDTTFYDASLNEYVPRVASSLTLEQALFSRSATFGGSEVGVGEISLVNNDGALDYLEDYGFDGRSIIVLLGDPGAAYSAFKTVFTGTMEQVELTFDEVRIRVRDKLALFDTPVQESTFAGTNVGAAGIEGSNQDIGGQVKPRLWGRMRHVPALQVNASSLIYAVNFDASGNTAAVSSFDAIYDQGVSITIAADYANLAALQGATIPTGQAATCIAEGLFRMERIFGLVTCDVTESATAADNKLPRVLERIITDAGGSVTAGDVAVLQSSSNYDVGFWAQSGETYLQVLDAIAQSDGVSFYGARTGATEFRLNRLTAGEIDNGNDLDDAAWIKSNSSISANAVAAPDGTTTADKIVEDIATGTHLIQRTSIPVGASQTYTFEVFAKAAERTNVSLAVNDGTSDVGVTRLNLSTGAMTTTAGTGSVVALTNGWYHIVLQAPMGGGATAATATVYVNDSDANATSYLGDGSSGLYAWGAGFFRGAYVGTLLELDGETPILGDYFDILDIERTVTGDQGRGIPATTVDVLWGPIGRTASASDLAASLITSNPERIEFFRVERRTKSTTVASARTKHPLAPTLSFTTQLYNETDADTVSARFSALYGETRRMFIVTTQISSSLGDTIVLGAWIKLELNRWSLSYGKRFLIVGIEYDASAFEYELTVWG